MTNRSPHPPQSRRQENPAPRIVLGIETSCDETAVALVDSNKSIIAQSLISQKEHGLWGGVVPEIAARAHLDMLDRLAVKVLRDGAVKPQDLAGVAATAGPGLIGGLLIGLTFAKALAMASGVPFIAVNHLAAHALSPRLQNSCPFPYLLLLASGGHCLLALARGPNSFVHLGRCLDDAPGETFDKTARLLGLGYPGGAEIERRARDGNGRRFALPRPMRGKAHCDFSFSGLKSAVRRIIDATTGDDRRDDPCFIPDMCACLQDAIGDIFLDRIDRALSICRQHNRPIDRLAFVGGVAANRHLRRRIEDFSRAQRMRLIMPDTAICTDNAAMVAWAGLETMAENRKYDATIGATMGATMGATIGATTDAMMGAASDWHIGARSRWPLDTGEEDHS